MEDESGLELSLGLSCGASSAKSKGGQRQESAPWSQRSDSGRPSKGSESSTKRKMSFDSLEKSKQSHISIPSDDDSTDVSDSEVGSTSMHVSHHDNVSKQFRNFSYGNPHPYRTSVNDPNSAITNERSGTQSTNTFTFGYSPVGIVTYPSQFAPSSTGNGPLNANERYEGLKTSQGPVQAIARPSSEAAQQEGRTLEKTRVEDKQKSSDSAASSRVENVQGSRINLRPGGDSFSLDFSAIKPGIAAELKFGGSGSYPNLPWVSTTGSGPHGRTISGVTYRYGASQIRIVCACHGTHMSPEEFVRHANEEYAKPENNVGLATFSSTNPAASAQS